jgi:hypothetical protein
MALTLGVDDRHVIHSFEMLPNRPVRARAPGRHRGVDEVAAFAGGMASASLIQTRRSSANAASAALSLPASVFPSLSLSGRRALAGHPSGGEPGASDLINKRTKFSFWNKASSSKTIDEAQPRSRSRRCAEMQFLQ